MNLKNFKKTFILLCCFLTIIACEVDSNCGSTAVNYITVSSATISGTNEEEERIITYDSIINQASNLLFLRDSATSFLVLPLDPGRSETTYQFYHDDTVDTIALKYDKRSRIDSPECGIDFEFVDLDTVFQTFDSLVIVNDTLRRTIDAPNIKFYITL